MKPHPAGLEFARRALTAGLALACLASITSAADSGPRRGQDSKEKEVESSWSVTPDPALPDVLILGDSVSIDYTLEVRRLLSGRANVFRPLNAAGTEPENCAGTTRGAAMIDRWLGERKWAVIHFNFGLHDMKHVARPGDDIATNRASDPRQADLERYQKNLEHIVARLKTTGARLVFATTTPVPPGTSNPMREPAAPLRYNAAALAVMKVHGVHFNDLHAFCAPHLDKLQRPRNVHFTETGSKALAGEVAKVIEQELAVR